MNTLPFLKEVYKQLQNAGIKVWVFGGWAEELHKLILPREHNDIDLLYPGKDFSSIDAFVSQKRLKIVKKFPHKRAFLYQRIMVEVFLVEDKSIINFFSKYLYRWPKNCFEEKTIEGMHVANIETLKEYRQKHYLVESASRSYFKQFS